MNSIVARLRDMEDSLDDLATDAFDREIIPELSSGEVAELLAVAGRVQRRLEGVELEAVAQVRSRSTGAVAEKMTTQYGCSSPIDLTRMLLGTDTNQAARLVRASRGVGRERNITEGGYLPARYPALYAAIREGVLGVAGLLAATGPLESASKRISDEDRYAADAELASFARGASGVDDVSEDAPRPQPLPEDLSLLAQVIVAYLDPDGADPSEQEGLRNRSLRIGSLRDGVHKISGGLLPEVAAQLQLLLDAVLNPRIDSPDNPDHGSGDSADVSAPGGVRFEETGPDDLGFDHGPDDPAFLDTRSRAQKLHDALASILKTTAETDLLPHLGGAAPTLVVTANAADLAHAAATGGTGAGAGAGLPDDEPESDLQPGTARPIPGWGTVLNTATPVPLHVAFHTACTGGIQRILFDERGRISSLDTSARIFNALQRRAIMARDGGCIIPGCTVPATWCEIHHVQEYCDGGPTHTDNGALLCWWHHRTLHLTEWTIRMTNGVPEIRGPAWWDPHQHWHRACSPHRPSRAEPPPREPAPT